MSVAPHHSPLLPAKDDLIVARSTAPGPAAVAIVRLDGPGTAQILNRMFHPENAPRSATPVDRPRRMVFGHWLDPATGEPIDDGLTVFFRAPHSYTGNDLAEFHCHGGAIPSRRLIETALKLGARMAEPGEFTRRAFLNGRLDLTQAEAVADLINAQTEMAARLARRQLSGALSARVHAARDDLLQLAAEIEARLDFPDEDLEPADRRRLADLFDRIQAALDGLLETRRRGRLLREGARVVLVGSPNAGKSSLLNALARLERAIVTPHPGTTRDTIECTIDLAGVPLTLVDTAGLRESEDPIERLGIERTRREIERADLVILIHDAGASPGDPDAATDPAIVVRRPDLIALNKIDLLDECGMRNAECGIGKNTLPISATRGDGLAQLERAILERLTGESTECGMRNAECGIQSDESEMAVNLRQGEALREAAESLAAARQSFERELSGEFVMVDLRAALDALGALLGLEVGDAILDRIFSRFCLGK